MRANSFILEQTPFQKGLCVKESEQEVTGCLPCQKWQKHIVYSIPLELRIYFLMTDHLSFFITINFFSVSGCHHHRTGFRTKSSAIYTADLRHLQMDMVQNHIYLMFKSIISQILTIVLDKYKEKIGNEKCLV